jgi:hypothetical protein
MKKLLMLFLSLSMLSSYCYSQKKVDIGLRGGMSVPNIISGSDNPLSKGYTSRFAGGGGLFTELGLNDVFSVRFGVEYTGQGGKRNGMQAMSSNQVITDLTAQMGAAAGAIPGLEAILGGLSSMSESLPLFYADVKNTAKFDYLMIPVSLQAGRNLSETPWRIYANAGPFISFLMSGKQVSKGSSKFYLDGTKTATIWDAIGMAGLQDVISDTPGLEELERVLKDGTELGTSEITQELRPINVGIQGNLGLSYKYRQSRIFVEVGGNYGFVRIQKNKDNGSNRLGSAVVMLGCATTLNFSKSK